MKKLPGHKPGCGCVGCNPAARKKGMAALNRMRYQRMKKKALRKMPKTPSACPYCGQRHGPGQCLPANKNYGPKKVCHQKTRKARKACRARVSKEIRHLVRKRHYPKRRAVAASLSQERRGKLTNYPAIGNYIGSNVSLHNPLSYHSKTKLYTSSNPCEIIMTGEGGRWPRVGRRFKRLDYDNKPKALRSYGRAGRFTHSFKNQVEVARVQLYKGGKWAATMRADANIWKRG